MYIDHPYGRRRSRRGILWKKITGQNDAGRKRYYEGETEEKKNLNKKRKMIGFWNEKKKMRFKSLKLIL